VTKRLIFTGPRGGHVWRTSLNEEVWKRALASAGVIPERKPGESYAESRENGMHALRRQERTRKAVSAIFRSQKL
jgi:DNA-binding LacI/PurR family transcriptional regulator